MEITVKNNDQFGSIELYFDSKPSEAVREALKALKFRWHNLKKCWYGKAEKSAVLEAVANAQAGKQPETTAPTEVKAEPISAKEAERMAEAITRGPEEHSKCGLPEHWRKVWRENGIKGVTVRNNRGGYSYHYTFTFRMMPGDVMPEAEALRVLEGEFEKNPHFMGESIQDPDQDENAGWYRWTEFYNWDGEKQKRYYRTAAERAYRRLAKYGPGCIVHAWNIYINREKMRREYPVFTDHFWDRLEVVAHSVACLNYDNSDAMTDYFDVGFYETWDFVAPKEGAKDDAEMAVKMHAVAEVFRAKEEAAKNAEEEEKRAEAEREREEEERKERHAREVIDEYVGLFPCDPSAPHVFLKWSEFTPLAELSAEFAGEPNPAGADAISLDAFEMITGELDAYYGEMKGYYKLAFTLVDGESEFNDRCDIGEGTGSYGARMRHALEWLAVHPGRGDESHMLDGGACVTRDEYEAHARRYLDAIPATFGDIDAA